MNFEDFDLSDEAVSNIEQIEGELSLLDRREAELTKQIATIINQA